MYEIIATGTSQKLELDAMLAPGIPVVKLSRLFGRSMHPPKGRWSRNLFRKYSGGGARDTGLRRGIVDVLVNLCVFFFFIILLVARQSTRLLECRLLRYYTADNARWLSSNNKLVKIMTLMSTPRGEQTRENGRSIL